MADWLDFLTGVGSLFSDPNKTKQTGSEVSTTVGEQALTSTGQTTTNQTQYQAGTETSKQTGTSVGSSTSAVTGKTAESTSAFSQPVMDALNKAVMGAMNSGGQVQATDSMKARLQQLSGLAAKPEFDVSGYVKGVTEAAQVNTQMDLESRVNGMLSQTGSSETGNSMAALLGNRMRNDAAATMGGIAANATAQGEQIRMQERESLTSQIGSIAGDLTSQLESLLNQAKGGTTVATGTQSQNTKATDKTTQTTTGTTKTNTKQTNKTDAKTSETGLTQIKQQKDSKTKLKETKGDLFSRLTDGLKNSNLAA